MKIDGCDYEHKYLRSQEKPNLGLPNVNIALVVDTLTIGGAETFVLRLAEALQTRYGMINLFVLRADLVDPELARRVSSKIAIRSARITALSLVLKLDGVFYSLGLRLSFLRWMQVRELRKYLAANQINIVHSHLLTTDLVVARATKNSRIAWLTTMHGDYLAFENWGDSRAARIHEFRLAFDEVAGSVGHVVCITDQQVAQIARLSPRLLTEGRLSKIYNGYRISPGQGDEDSPSPLATIPANAFVMGMVSRGIREKGWEVVIRAFLELQLAGAWLVLVGDGDYVKEISQQVSNERILFVGNVSDPLRYIVRFDIACLPSLYETESLPTVVIEYMVLAKPVIATEVGEIPSMLEANTDRSAGLLIKMGSVDQMVEQMKAALLKAHDHPEKRAEWGANAREAAKKFDMDACVDAYAKIYESLVQ